MTKILPRHLLKFLSIVPRFILSINDKFGCLIWFFKKKDYSSISEISFRNRDFSKFAICLQGPCAKPEKVTQLIDFFFQNYPGVKIFYNTTGVFYHQKAEVKTINHPKNFGFGYFNSIVIHLKDMLENAQQLNCLYALKIRDDLSVTDPDALDYLHSLIENFKGSNGQRIFFSHLHSRLHIPFHVCDFMIFGTVKDLLGMIKAIKLHDKTITKQEWLSELKGKIKISDLQKSTHNPHVSFGRAAFEFFSGRQISKEYHANWLDWQNLIREDIGFFNLHDVGVFYDRDESILFYPSHPYDSLFEQITTKKWLTLMQIEFSDIKDQGPIFDENTFY